MIPENELGVIVLFAQQAEVAGYEILRVSSTFPDAIIRHRGQKHRVEFEFASSNFMMHDHDPGECDLIICWHHDWPECRVPVLVLSDPGWRNTGIIQPLVLIPDPKPEPLPIAAAMKGMVSRAFVPTPWRIETTNHGRSWMWRKGSGRMRRAIWGGTFHADASEKPDGVGED